MKTIGGRKILEAKDAQTGESQKPIAPQALVAALDRLFKNEGWEIPDSCVEGKLMNKVLQLEARIDSLTDLLGKLNALVKGADAVPAGRVDPIALSKKEKASK